MADTQQTWQFGMPLSRVRDVWARRFESLVTPCERHPTWDGTVPPASDCQLCKDKWCVMERVRNEKEKEAQRRNRKPR
jgi:hypothetical protein